MKTYKELTVWQKSFKLTLEIYKTTKRFPKSELYGLTSQMRRSATAIPSNIAEGYCRRHRKEYIRFLSIAFASGAELETQLLLAEKLRYLVKEEFSRLNSLLTEVMKMLNVLLNRLETKP